MNIINEVLKLLQQNGIEGFFVSDHFGERIEFELQNFKFMVKIKKSTTIEDFKKEVDEQYLIKIKSQAELHKSISDSYFKQIDSFNGVFK